MHDDVAVLIPYYKDTLSEAEQISLKQCLKVLSAYPIILIIPDNMEKAECQHEDVLYEKVPAAWLESVAAYNQMMLTLDFYMRFKKYEYILIYQLDAFVFSDQLDRFCQYGFDYIGAPWLTGIKYYKDFTRCVWHVGNGGLSLRKVDSFIRILMNITIEDSSVVEDIFWASCEGEEFRVAPIDIALQFAFECDAEKCYLLNGNCLPFGCHAWEKRNYTFWKPHIENAGYSYEIENVDCVKESRNESDSGLGYRHLETDKEIIRESCIQYLHSEGKDIYIWGSGIWGEECGWLLKKCGTDKFRYVDADCIRQQETLWEIPIESPEVLMKKKKEHVVIIIAVKGKEKEILDVLEKEGYRYQQEVFFYVDWIEDFSQMYRNK